MWFIRINMRSGRSKGLSVSQFRTLVRAERRGTLSDVAGCLGTTLPTASRIVSGLVTKGYLRRDESAEDRRCCHLSLTTQGQRILKDAFAVTQAAMEAELQQLADGDCESIGQSLRTIGKVFSAGANV